MKFHVPDMSCGHCTAAITRGIQAADPAAQVTPDLPSRTVKVTTALDTQAVLALLAREGYAATPTA